MTVQGPVKKLQPDGMSHRGALSAHAVFRVVQRHLKITSKCSKIRFFPGNFPTGSGMGLGPGN